MAVVPDEPIRLLVIGLSTLVRELIESAKADDIVLMDAAASADLVDAIRHAQVDFVLLPLDGSELPSTVKRYLSDQAHVRVIGVHEADGRAIMYQLVPEARELGEVTPTGLLDEIRRTPAYSMDVA